MSEPQCTLVLALAVFWAAASAAVMLDSIAHNRKALAWLWAASFAGASLGAAYCFGRLAWVVA